jgi:hypothetical protein
MAFLPNRVLLGSYAHVARDELPTNINLCTNRDGGVLIMSELWNVQAYGAGEQFTASGSGDHTGDLDVFAFVGLALHGADPER